MNINDMVWVKLTPYGEQIWGDYWNGVPDSVRIAQTDKKGWLWFELHNLMLVFGPVMCVGNPNNPFINNEILTDRPR